MSDMGGPIIEPDWLVPKIDQRMEWLVETGGIKVAKDGGAPFIFTFVDEGKSEMTLRERERWERTCDNCGVYTPDDGEFYTGYISRIVDDIQVLMAFGVCSNCKNNPMKGTEK